MAEKNEQDRTEIVNPIAQALGSLLDRRAARPLDVYRLAVIVEGMMDSLDDPDAMRTIRGELRSLLNDLSQNMT
ncbi:MAG: hypothetical protein K8L97_01725 [Anaerolineae bacterium]|nr:hypothetical protein [Anaerolineae bacterium]